MSRRDLAIAQARAAAKYFGGAWGIYIDELCGDWGIGRPESCSHRLGWELC
jgi:hypothetical protein